MTNCPTNGAPCFLFPQSFQTYATARSLDHFPTPLNVGTPLQIADPYQFPSAATPDFVVTTVPGPVAGYHALDFPPAPAIRFKLSLHHRHGIEAGLALRYEPNHFAPGTLEPGFKIFFRDPRPSPLELASFLPLAGFALLFLAIVIYVNYQDRQDARMYILTRSSTDTERGLVRLFQKKYGVQEGYRAAGDINQRLAALIVRALENHRGGRVRIDSRDIEGLNLTDEALIAKLTKKGFTLRELSDHVAREERVFVRVEAPYIAQNDDDLEDIETLKDKESERLKRVRS